MLTHQLKIYPEYFNAVAAGEKKFEYRKNDRDFHVGDTLQLRELAGEYTGREIKVKVTYMLTKFDALPDGWCIMSIE